MLNKNIFNKFGEKYTEKKVQRCHNIRFSIVYANFLHFVQESRKMLKQCFTAGKSIKHMTGNLLFDE